jgi:hypothetical protein
MMLADLRTLHQEIGEVLRRLEALAPCVATWAAARRPQEALGAAPSDPGPRANLPIAPVALRFASKPPKAAEFLAFWAATGANLASHPVAPSFDYPSQLDPL